MVKGKTVISLICILIMISVQSLAYTYVPTTTATRSHLVKCHLPCISLTQAIIYTLLQNPDILLQRQEVLSTRGIFQRESGPFDPNVRALVSHERTNVPLLASERAAFFDFLADTITSTTIYEGALTKLYRNGVQIEQNVRVTRLDTNIKDFNGIPAENRADVNFVLRAPFFKGSLIGAEQEATRLEYEAEINDLQQTIAQRVSNTAVAYWNYVGAVHRVEIFAEAVKRALRFTNNIRKLIAHDEIPAADINLTLANLASKRAALITAEQALERTRKELADITGIDYETAKDLPLPCTPFPALRAEVEKIQCLLDFFVDKAIKDRKDITAEEKRLQANIVRTKEAHRNLNPNVDLTFSVGYSGLTEGNDTFSAFGGRVSGPNTLARVEYKYPICNNEARGTLLNRIAEREQSIITLNNLARTIQLNVMLEASNLQHTIAEVKESTLSVQYYLIAIRNEVKKLQYGNSTIVDVIRVEDQLLDSLLTQLDEEIDYASSLARFNFEIGSIVKQDHCRCKVQIYKLL